MHIATGPELTGMVSHRAWAGQYCGAFIELPPVRAALSLCGASGNGHGRTGFGNVLEEAP